MPKLKPFHDGHTGTKLPLIVSAHRWTVRCSGVITHQFLVDALKRLLLRPVVLVLAMNERGEMIQIPPGCHLQERRHVKVSRASAILPVC